MKRESRTVDRFHQGDSQTQCYLPLVDLLVDLMKERNMAWYEEVLHSAG